MNSPGGWDFFISYTQADRAWAEWIARILEEDGHRVLIQAWDFTPGTDWVHRMQAATQDAARTIAVLSHDYVESVYTEAHWRAAWASDPEGTGRKLLTVRVDDTDRPGLLGTRVGVDLFGLDEATAKARLRGMVSAAITGRRTKPEVSPGFPGARRAMPRPALFPRTLPQVSSGGIFLNYRREDAAPYARLLQYQLRELLPDVSVFMDLDSIEPGRDFAEVIQEALNSCAVLVALIGRQWVTFTDEHGDRRLDNPDDYVRFEIQTALERDVRVIPVLVDDAKSPRKDQLPAELHKLARLNALELSYGRYEYDANRLLNVIQRVLTGN